MKAFPSKQQGFLEYLGIVDGEPKFQETEPAKENAGMDLRDYFAAKAMDKVTFGGAPRIKEPEEGWMLRDAIKAYEIADAMMKARNNERT